MDEVLVFTDERMLEHDPGPGHPERPERLAAVLRSLADTPIEGVRRVPAPLVAQAALRLVHGARHLESLSALEGRSTMIDPDTVVSPSTIEAARLAAGATVAAVAAVCTGDARRAFALVRPPGHHAEPGRAMGFCFFSNIAVAAAHARDTGQAERVLIVDWDVHHGNGTQAAFEHRDDVLFISAHEWPQYPGTGAARETGTGDGRGFTINAPLPAGCGDDVYVDLFRRLVVPAADRFRPDLVLVSAGYDAHADDPLASMNVSTEGFATLTSIVRDIADRHAGGRIVLVLEGGYDVPVLVASVRASLEVLAGGRPREAPATTTPLVDALLAAQGDGLASRGPAG